MSCKLSNPLRGSTALLAAILLAAGCVTGPGRGGRIDSLHVFTVPVALDLNGSPGPDGFGLTLYASNAARARGIPITAGSMEILMFDGVPQDQATTNATPRRLWTFTIAELRKHGIKTSLGTGYRFTPRWGDTPPLQNRITIVASYVAPGGNVVRSAPTTIALSPK